MAAVGVLVAAGLVAGRGSDGGETAAVPTTELATLPPLPPAPSSAPDVPITSGDDDAAVPTSGVVPGEEPSEGGPMGSIEPLGLPVVVVLSRFVSQDAGRSGSTVIALVDLETGKISPVSSPTTDRWALVSVHDTAGGPLAFQYEGPSGVSVLRPLGQPVDEPAIATRDGFVVTADGTVWTIDLVRSELRRYAPGTTEPAEVRPLPSTGEMWLYGVDAQGDPILRAPDLHAYVARPDLTFELVEHGGVIAMRGSTVVATSCDERLRCTTKVRTPRWEYDLEQVAWEAQPAPVGDAVAVMGESGVHLVGGDGSLVTTVRTDGRGIPGRWTADGNVFVVPVDPTTLVVWEVTSGTTVEVSLPDDWQFSETIGVFTHAF